MKQVLMLILSSSLFLFGSTDFVFAGKIEDSVDSVSKNGLGATLNTDGTFSVAVADVGIVNKKIDEIPYSFPEFKVPGLEKQLELLRELFYLHYAGTSPRSTVWDGWLTLGSLWPNLETESGVENMRASWSHVLLNRHMDLDGYISTHQHDGLAHGHGWPFPLWTQAKGVGWQFSLNGMPFGKEVGVYETRDVSKWDLKGVKTLGFNSSIGWEFAITDNDSYITTPGFLIESFVAPFIRIQWKADGLKETSNPYMEWTTVDQPKFSSEHRVYFSPIKASDGMVYTHIAMYKLPNWKGKITKLRFNFKNTSDAKVTVKSIITAVDSRHNINNSVYIQGCEKYVNWTGDLTFLRKNIGRMRKALRYAMDEFSTYKNKCVSTPWIGHDGRSGYVIDSDGNKVVSRGRGIGSNWWDLLPFGGKDCLATIYYYDSLKCLARIERLVSKHPEWNIPDNFMRFDPDELEHHAKEVKDYAGKLFWNKSNGRFVSAIDINGKGYDYGFTFVNCEAIYYGFANEKQAKSIIDWLSGKRIVDGDTSKGEDIYHWRFAPRATTKRNLEYYDWVWGSPESLSWGDQIQDGGAVLGFSYHDLMARLIAYGPDNAWQRLSEILDWFEDVKSGGGYRKYYADEKNGKLQGAWTQGGLGLDAEFFESSMVPQVMLYGFMGFSPCLDGFLIDPKLPNEWTELSITSIKLHDIVLNGTVAKDNFEFTMETQSNRPLFINVLQGDWEASYFNADGKVILEGKTISKDRKFPLQYDDSRVVKLKRSR